MEKQDLICTCGHTKFKHSVLGSSDWVSGCAARNSNGDWTDACMSFHQDNLKYLEMKYESR